MTLGSALVTLGERESGTVRLEEAVAAYRAALEEWTRERVPLQWAMTHTIIRNVLPCWMNAGRHSRRSKQCPRQCVSLKKEGI
jgi:hypothetical protein